MKVICAGLMGDSRKDLLSVLNGVTLRWGGGVGLDQGRLPGIVNIYCHRQVNMP